VRRGSGRLFVFTRIITAVPKAHRGPLMYKKAHTLNILPTSPACIFLALFCAHFLFHSLALALSLSRSSSFLLMLCCICILARQKSVLICDVRRLNSHRTFLLSKNSRFCSLLFFFITTTTTTTKSERYALHHAVYKYALCHHRIILKWGFLLHRKSSRVQALRETNTSTLEVSRKKV
jgi:hypothetical protein